MLKNIKIVIIKKKIKTIKNTVYDVLRSEVKENETRKIIMF
jgi:hypothetical protein